MSANDYHKQAKDAGDELAWCRTCNRWQPASHPWTTPPLAHSGDCFVASDEPREQCGALAFTQDCADVCPQCAVLAAVLAEVARQDAAYGSQRVPGPWSLTHYGHAIASAADYIRKALQLSKEGA